MTRLGVSYYSRFAALPAPVRGVLWMGLAAILLTGMATIVKQLSADLHTFQIVFFRTAMGLPFMLPWLVRSRGAGLKTQKLGVLAVRGVVTMVAASCFFAALKLAPLADATAIMFSRPLFATVMAILLLNEAVSGRRWTAMIVGFLGVLIILRPGFAELNIGLVLAMIGAVFGAGAASFVRYLSRTDSPDTITVYFLIFMTLYSVGPAIYFWTPITWEHAALILALGFVGATGQRAMSRAVATADISIVLPVDFTRLVIAAIIGWFLFAEVPTVWVWVGGAIIFGSSFYIARRESRERAKPRHP